MGYKKRPTVRKVTNPSSFFEAFNNAGKPTPNRLTIPGHGKNPKFIIENGKLILMMVEYHFEIVSDKEKIEGGGWFRFNENTNTITFYGESIEFGRARKENILILIENKQIYAGKHNPVNISEQYQFDVV